jgi:hypothetical protein
MIDKIEKLTQIKIKIPNTDIFKMKEPFNYLIYHKSIHFSDL